jgi:hypothetical protein
MTSGVVVTEDGVYDTWEQFMAGVHSFKLSLFVSVYSHELGSTRAKYTVQLGQSNNFLYTESYQLIKTWSLLSEGNQSKSWEKEWVN